MGAGDVKLMVAAGTFLGVPLLFWGAVCSAVAGGVLVMILAFRTRAVCRVAFGTCDLMTLWASGDARKAGVPTLDDPGALAVPYGVAIAAGCAFATFFPELSIF